MPWIGFKGQGKVYSAITEEIDNKPEDDDDDDDDDDLDDIREKPSDTPDTKKDKKKKKDDKEKKQKIPNEEIPWESHSPNTVIDNKKKEITVPKDVISNVIANTPILKPKKIISWKVYVNDFKGNYLCMGILEKDRVNDVHGKPAQEH